MSRQITPVFFLRIVSLIVALFLAEFSSYWYLAET